MSGPKILILDIESSPHLSWHFGVWKVDIAPIQNVQPSRTISVAAKWHGQRKKSYVDERDGWDTMIRAIHAMMDRADVVVTYNGDNYDLPRLNRDFQLAGLQAPSPYTSIDLYKVVKKNFGTSFFSNKLGYLAGQLSLTGKLEHGGYFNLWLDMTGDDPERAAKAWRVFRRYNMQDLDPTEQMFDLLRDRIKTPAFGLFGDLLSGVVTCPGCGSDDFQSRGYRYTATRRYPRYCCNACGRWFSSTRSDGAVGVS